MGSFLAMVAVALMQLSLTPAAAEEPVGGWRAAWLTAMQQPNANPNWSQQGFAAESVRQVVRLSAGGPKVRIRISNQYGERPLRLTGATVARAAQGAAVEPGSVRTVRFGGAETISVPIGSQIASDAVNLPTATAGDAAAVPAATATASARASAAAAASPTAAATGSGGVRLAITLYFADSTGAATFHEYGAAGASYRATGDARDDTSGAAYGEVGGSWYFLAGVDVSGVGAGSVVAFGDSTTNGFRTKPGLRYPDLLAARLTAAGRPMPVLNAGLGGGRLLNDSDCFGESGLARFHRDVLDQPGVKTAVVLLGINDIGYPELPATPCLTPNPEITAEQLIDGYRTLIRDAHARGIRVVGVTIPPFRGADVHTERSERLWAAVNTWIRTTEEYDAVADFAAALADPADPTRLAPQYDSGDHVHPNEAGYRAMAEAIDITTL
ncbi:SGNH/GDSL hydrolase family protein [Kribbella sp. CA-294648]|uniref:SGNH/GDSL hydrolase family protein n=1 Tax=Kribbella sp. CA-294648 TaxID=3239948 RepID=UPI003D90AF9C